MAARGRGRFRRQCNLDGSLELSVSSGSTQDARLRWWIHESEVVLPRLQTMLKGDARSPELRVLLRGLEDLGRRVEKLEREMLRVRASS